MHVTGNLYVAYFSGDGYSLVLKKGEDDFKDVLKSSVLSIYKSSDKYIVKEKPLTFGADTLYYYVYYHQLYDSIALQPIRNKWEYDSVRNGLQDLIMTSAW